MKLLSINVEGLYLGITQKTNVKLPELLLINLNLLFFGVIDSELTENLAINPCPKDIWDKSTKKK